MLEEAGRGRAWTEIRRAWSWMLGQGRDCVHQSCAAVPSACMTVIRRWLCSYSFRAQVPCVDLLAGCSSRLSPCLVPSSLWVRWLPAFSVRRVSSFPGEGALLVLSVLRFFVLLVVLAVDGRFLLSLLGSCPSYDLDFGDFFIDSVFGLFCGIFRVAECPLGGAICGMQFSVYVLSRALWPRVGM